MAFGHGERGGIGTVRDKPSRVNSETHRDVVDFLICEAELLDDRCFDEWLELLAGDIEYVIPVRQSVSVGSRDGFDPEAAWLRENRRSIEARVSRLQAASPWSDDPPSRSRHFVSNIRVRPSAADDEVLALSNLLLFRSRGDGPEYELLSAERRDLLRQLDGEWKLVRREAHLDHASVGAQDFSVFL
jgi:3-phenylpropionate/cinnamic acid dioxygenase small subunit